MPFLGFFAPSKEPRIELPHIDFRPNVEASITHALISAAEKTREMIEKAETADSLAGAIRVLDLVITEYKAMPRILIEVTKEK